jgi:hypothetical protein
LRAIAAASRSSKPEPSPSSCNNKCRGVGWQANDQRQYWKSVSVAEQRAAGECHASSQRSGVPRSDGCKAADVEGDEWVSPRETHEELRLSMRWFLYFYEGGRGDNYFYEVVVVTYYFVEA